MSYYSSRGLIPTKYELFLVFTREWERRVHLGLEPVWYHFVVLSKCKSARVLYFDMFCTTFWQLISRSGFFYHNAKYLQIHWNKKQERRGTVQKILYYNMLSFYFLDRVVGSICVAQLISHLYNSIVSFDGCGLNCFIQIRSCIKFSDLEK